MADYAEMYKALFRAVTKAVDILQKAQQTTEEMYISADEPMITLLPSESGGENEDGDQ